MKANEALKVGDTFGQYTVVAKGVRKKEDNRLYVKVQCSCGRVRVVVPWSLINRHRSCNECAKKHRKRLLY